jgi:N-hydroxyarylamine O-acetyltransferase
MDASTVDRYLARISASRTDDVATLQERHLASVPFENLDIHLGVLIELDQATLVDKIVERRRGGFCYELNGLFAMLLRALGHHVELLAARVHSDGGLGPPFDHLALAVAADQRLLVDVGFGQFTADPLRFDDRGDQRDPCGRCRLVDIDGGDVDVLIDDRPQYRLELRPRRLDDFVPTCWWQQTSPDSHFTTGPVCSMPSGDGRVTLRGDRLIRTVGATRQETRLASDEEVLAAFREHFGIELAAVPRAAEGRDPWQRYGGGPMSGARR